MYNLHNSNGPMMARTPSLMARAADNKDRWVMLLDPATGKTKVLATVHDDAWVDGPGANTLGWLPDNTHVSISNQSEMAGRTFIQFRPMAASQLN